MRVDWHWRYQFLEKVHAAGKNEDTPRASFARRVDSNSGGPPLPPPQLRSSPYSREAFEVREHWLPLYGMVHEPRYAAAIRLSGLSGLCPAWRAPNWTHQPSATAMGAYKPLCSPLPSLSVVLSLSALEDVLRFVHASLSISLVLSLIAVYSNASV